MLEVGKKLKLISRNQEIYVTVDRIVDKVDMDNWENTVIAIRIERVPD